MIWIPNLCSIKIVRCCPVGKWPGFLMAFENPKKSIFFPQIQNWCFLYLWYQPFQKCSVFKWQMPFPNPDTKIQVFDFLILLYFVCPVFGWLLYLQTHLVRLNLLLHDLLGQSGLGNDLGLWLRLNQRLVILILSSFDVVILTFHRQNVVVALLWSNTKNFVNTEWESELWTNLVFKWLKLVWLLNGRFFQFQTTVGIWNPYYSGFWMVEKRLGCQWSGFQMRSEIPPKAQLFEVQTCLTGPHDLLFISSL